MVIQALLDTSIVIDLLRGQDAALAWLLQLESQALAITPVVWFETVQGAVNRTQQAQAIRFLRRFHFEHTTPDDDRWAMRQFARFQLSHKIGFPDVLIAAVAVRLDVPLFTLNLRHFEPLPDIRVNKPY